MTDALKVLAEHREALLLAEIGALLHDVGKCTSEFAYYPEARSGDTDQDPYKAVYKPHELARFSFSSQRRLARQQECEHRYSLHNLLPREALFAMDVPITIDSGTYSIREFVYFSRPRFAGHISRALRKPCDVLDLLAYCHGEAHAEKQEPFPPVKAQRATRDSPFGWQNAVLPLPTEQPNLTEDLSAVPWDRLGHDSQFLAELRQAFSRALGDTRIPINEVTLWDWSYAVASLFKSELARHVLAGGWRERDDLRWRILRVNVDVLALYARAVTIADLLASRGAVEAAWREVKRIVEEEYPLGNEVYRDTTGIYFTYPDLDLIPDLAERIRAAVEEVEPELAPHIAVGKGCGEKPADQLKRILADQRVAGRQDMAFPFSFEKAPEWWAACWQDLPEGRQEVCPICRLRPMREKEKECRHCHDRRRSRIETWLQHPSETIWLDEIADHNGRLALVVGRFGLDDWLSGDLVESMLVKAVKGQCESKNPSPARLRRVWQTTQAFWDETVVKTILANHPYAAETRAPDLRQCRVAVVPDDRGGWREDVPYDGIIGGQPISLLWHSDAQRFTTISNLQMVAGKARTVEELIGEWKRERQATVAPADSPRERRPFVVEGVVREEGEMGRYTPSLPLVTSPDQFLALMPAHDALDLAQRIFCRYEDEFARVRNRLPLLLGLVFFPRKLPLQAVIDTARRMLTGVRLEQDSWPLASAHDGCLTFENGVAWEFPLKMGDGATCDRWYPYVALEEGDAHERDLYFTHKSRTWVHAKHLRAGDRVRIYPSRFTYTFLENTAQRFLFDPDKDVLLLEELPLLRKMWSNLRQQDDLTDTKLQGVAALFDAKRREWRVDEAPTDGDERRALRELAEATLAREGLPGVTPDDVLDCRFHHCMQLHLHILRARLKEAS